MACLDDNPDVKNRMQVLLEQREAQCLVEKHRRQESLCTLAVTQLDKEQGSGDDQQNHPERSLSLCAPRRASASQASRVTTDLYSYRNAIHRFSRKCTEGLSQLDFPGEWLLFF